MLESIVAEDNKTCTNIQTTHTDLKSIRNRMDIISNVFRQITSVESIRELETKLTELEENHTCLTHLLAEIKTKRSQLAGILQQDNNENDNLLQEMLEEINGIEDLHQKTSIEVKSKIQSLSAIYQSWSFTDRIAGKLKAEFEIYYINLNPNKSELSVTYDLYGTKIECQPLYFSEADLRAIAQEVNAFKNSLDNLKNELDLATYLAHNTFFNSYSLLLDRFWSNVNILNEIYRKNQPVSEKATCLRSHKISDFCKDSQQKSDLNLELQSDDDQDNFQFDLRPDQLSTPRISNLNSNNTKKMFSDKSVATIEEKSSQTELKDSGIDLNVVDFKEIDVRMNLKQEKRKCYF
jgi:hypothetical protein